MILCNVAQDVIGCGHESLFFGSILDAEQYIAMDTQSEEMHDATKPLQLLVLATISS